MQVTGTGGLIYLPMSISLDGELMIFRPITGIDQRPPKEPSPMVPAFLPADQTGLWGRTCPKCTGNTSVRLNQTIRIRSKDIARFSDIITSMPLPNPKLFDPLKRIENAARCTADIILTTGDSLAPKDNELVLQEIAEIKNCLVAFEFAVESGELPGPQDSIRSLGGT
jgi:hypothetical protein